MKKVIVTVTKEGEIEPLGAARFAYSATNGTGTVRVYLCTSCESRFNTTAGREQIHSCYGPESN